MSEPEDQFFDISIYVPCDECGAKSWMWVSLRNGGTLTFCAHHGTKNYDALVADEAYIYDRRDAVLHS